MAEPAAYFITLSAYGSRLHGDIRGTALRRFNTDPFTPPEPPNPLREQTARAALRNASPHFDKARRRVIRESIAEVCNYHGWALLAVNVRTNHVHVVVGSPREVEFVMRALKARATLRLRESGLAGSDDRIWARHGSTRYLWTEQDIVDVATYVLDGQGPDLD